MAKCTDEAQDDIVANPGRRVQVPDDSCEAGLVQMVADGQQIDKTSQLVWQGPSVVKCSSSSLDGGLDACLAALCR